jgi:dTDP-4-amino-4,6-dideoxygalactose transaminase
VKAETRRVPLSRPYIGEREEELVLDVLRSGQLSLGPTIDRFEELFAERVGAPYAAAVSSGTAALHLLCHIAGVKDGDEVITSPISFVATANCFIFEGGRPVFADVDAKTLNLDPAAVEAAITERTKGIVAVDMFGYPCELDELRAIAERHGLWIIDDSCEALGAEYKGKPVGSHGISGAFGFYPNKQITTGEGGIVTTHSEEEWELLKSLRNQGRSYESRWFHHVRLGFNYRFTDLQAAVGIVQLEKLDEILRLRVEAAARYGELLAGVDGVETPHLDDADHKRSWFVYVTKLAPGLDREAVMARLADEGIEAAHYVPCVHLQPYMRERYGFAEGVCPVAEDASDRSMALPFFTGIEAADQELVVEKLREVLAVSS